MHAWPGDLWLGSTTNTRSPNILRMNCPPYLRRHMQAPSASRDYLMSLAHLEPLQSCSLEMEASRPTLRLFLSLLCRVQWNSLSVYTHYQHQRILAEKKNHWSSCHVALGSSSLQGIIFQGLMIYGALARCRSPVCKAYNTILGQWGSLGCFSRAQIP